jgi:hypothetical protein
MEGHELFKMKRGFVGRSWPVQVEKRVCWKVVSWPIQCEKGVCRRSWPIQGETGVCRKVVAYSRWKRVSNKVVACSRLYLKMCLNSLEENNEKYDLR